MASPTKWTGVWTNWETVRDREAWCATIHGVEKSQTWLSDWIELNWTELGTSAEFQISQAKFLLITFCSSIRILNFSSLWPHGLYSSWNSPGRNTRVGSRSLLQGIFPTQGSNPGFSHCRQIVYQLSHRGSPRILEWAAYPFSRGSSQPRSQTRVCALQADSLPAELQGKPQFITLQNKNSSVFSGPLYALITKSHQLHCYFLHRLYYSLLSVSLSVSSSRHSSSLLGSVH